MIGNKRKREGFSLLEVLIAMTVLSIGLMAYVVMFGQGYKALQSSSNRTVASRLLQDKMERLRSSLPAPVLNAEEEIDGMTLRWSIQKSVTDDNIWVISVEVTWKDLKGLERTVFLKSFRAL
ncbi:MAG: type IV pilus modification protein PilV [Nitrospiria bacterium]